MPEQNRVMNLSFRRLRERDVLLSLSIFLSSPFLLSLASSSPIPLSLSLSILSYSIIIFLLFNLHAVERDITFKLQPYT